MLVYSARLDVIPKGIRIAIRELIEIRAINSTEIYNVVGYLYTNILFLPITKQNKKPYTDQMTNSFTTINGDQCAADGGITGFGIGVCRGMLFSKEAIKYNIEIKIKP